MLVEIEQLNEAQRAAVECVDGPLLVLAGAGTGKTRVLTMRIAHLINDCGVYPHNILAITFTNKAAKEMRERLTQMLGTLNGMWVKTFHGMCLVMLKQHAHLLGYTESFTIYDDTDTRRLIKEICESQALPTKTADIMSIRSAISGAKNALVDPDEYAQIAQANGEEDAARVYAVYNDRLKRANAMDFDDLLVNAYRLFTQHPEVLEAYQHRFTHISVDEYQDTNHVQYKLVNLLASAQRNLMVVGDDDQSIYSWRGADISNILNFEQDYPEARVVKLEQNYRSTSHILDAAHAVVQKNEARRDKKLFTTSGQGEKVRIYRAENERDEGRWIAGEIERNKRAGMSYGDMAVFYRTNAQSRTIEDMMLRAGVPYKIVGGTRFFDREEIRDVMAYLKTVVNPHDDMSLKRIVNKPARGIGKASIQYLEQIAASERISFVDAMQKVVNNSEYDQLSLRAKNALRSFLVMLADWRAYEGSLAPMVELIVQRSQIIAALEGKRDNEAQERLGNIREFMSVVQEFEEEHSVQQTIEVPADESAQLGLASDEPVQDSEVSLGDFVEWLTLRTDLDALSGHSSAVTLMTVHAAKGLEFDHVYVAGMEEGLFPLVRGGLVTDTAQAEEERRLAYVAFTRAGKKLSLVYAATRQIYGTTQCKPRSRFISEIPEAHCEFAGLGSKSFSGTGWDKRGDRHGTYGSGTGSSMYGGSITGKTSGKSRAYADMESLGGRSAKPPTPMQSTETFAVGDVVEHKTFGRGKVVAVNKDMLSVRFAKTGATKQLLKGFAPLVKVNKG